MPIKNTPHPWRGQPRDAREAMALRFLVRYAAIGLAHENNSCLAAELFADARALDEEFGRLVLEEQRAMRCAEGDYS